MKKLMIAAAIVCAAVASQAATASWSCSKVYAPGTSDFGEGFGVYFIQSADLELSSAQSYLAAKDLDSVMAKVTAGSYGTIDADGMGGVDKWGDFGKEETVTGYLLVVNADTAANATMAYLSGERSGTTGGEGQEAGIGFKAMDGTKTWNTDTRVTGNWYAVPEPTSGLLLLVGLGALALRRRRA